MARRHPPACHAGGNHGRPRHHPALQGDFAGPADHGAVVPNGARQGRFGAQPRAAADRRGVGRRLQDRADMVETQIMCRYADDMVSMPLQCGTQWDSLAHVFAN